MRNPGWHTTKLFLIAVLAAVSGIAASTPAQEQASQTPSAPAQPASETAGTQAAPDPNVDQKPDQKAAPKTDPKTDSTASLSPDRKADETEAQQTKKGLKDDRIFGILPNYATVGNEDSFGPLSVKQKFMLSVDSIVDPYTFAFIGVQAGISQAQNSEPAYGQGMMGFAKRYGTSFADAGIGTTMTTSLFPALLHQDPRYFQSGTGSILHRTEYSISRLFVTRSDSGEHQFNTSEILGNLVAAGISNTYHPTEDRSVANTMSVWGTDIMWDGVSNVLKEFWPDIRRHFQKKHDDQD
jgi:hypothetical protein